MNSKIQNWLVIGIPQNWETALLQPMPIWGLKDVYKSRFQSMKASDLIWFYASKPVGGIIGVGVVKDQYVDNTNLVWPDELKQGKVIWPLRFRIHVLKVLPKESWKTHRIKIDDFDLVWQIGFQLLKEDQAIELFKRVERSFGVINEESLYTGTTIAEPLVLREKPPLYTQTEEKLVAPHRGLQEKIAEIGKLQFYYTQLEHAIELPGEKKSLDVVWKREIEGVPTYAFEIELSGMIEKSMERLKFAFRKWNSRPRIIIPENMRNKAQNIISASDKDFSEQVKIYQPMEIANLLDKKRELKSIEQGLDMY